MNEQVPWNNRQDRIAAAIANGVLRALATDRYQKFVRGAIEYGMRSAARDAELGWKAPPDWRPNASRNPYPQIEGEL